MFICDRFVGIVIINGVIYNFMRCLIRKIKIFFSMIRKIIKGKKDRGILRVVSGVGRSIGKRRRWFF